MAGPIILKSGKPKWPPTWGEAPGCCCGNPNPNACALCANPGATFPYTGNAPCGTTFPASVTVTLSYTNWVDTQLNGTQCPQPDPSGTYVVPLSYFKNDTGCFEGVFRDCANFSSTSSLCRDVWERGLPPPNVCGGNISPPPGGTRFGLEIWNYEIALSGYYKGAYVSFGSNGQSTTTGGNVNFVLVGDNNHCGGNTGLPCSPIFGGAGFFVPQIQSYCIDSRGRVKAYLGFECSKTYVSEGEYIGLPVISYRHTLSFG